jgi:hypothetical protein
MIILELKEPRKFKVGEIIHLKINHIYNTSPGSWKLIADDVTPLPGAEPTGFGCHICGRIDPAKPDGSLPDGWTKKDYEQGSCFICPEDQGAAVCRVCGCTDEHGCETDDGPCSWVEPDLCSACALPLVRNSMQKSEG